MALLGLSVTPKELFLLALLSFLVWLVYSRYLAALANVPGPFFAGFSRLWMVKHSRTGTMHRTYIDLHKKYGPVVRIGPTEVSISDPTALRAIYGAGSKFTKSGWYGIWKGYANINIFGETDEKIHGSQRRLMSKIYSLTSLLEMEESTDNAIKEFMEQLGNQKATGVNLGLWLQLFAFDVVGHLTFSRGFGFLKEGRDDGTLKSIEGALFSAAWIGQVPALFWFMLSIATFIGDRVAVSANKGRLIEFAEREIADRKRRGPAESKHSDLLGKILKVQEEKPDLVDDEFVLAIPAQTMFAGSDTTAITLRTIVYHILRNPQIKASLLEEIRGMQKNGDLSNPVRYGESKRMPFLQACISEALRIHPAVGMTLPRIVPEGGFNIAGHHLPAGTTVGMSAWVVHRDESVFGKDPDVFRPERWLSRDTKEMDRCSLAFGQGARTCIGKNISLIEISKIIPTLFLNFDIELVAPASSLEENCCFFVIQEGLHARVQPRLLKSEEIGM